MNMLLHGIGVVDSASGVSPLDMESDKEQRRDASATFTLEVPIEVRDALGSQGRKNYEMVMTNPPFGKKSSVTIVRALRDHLLRGYTLNEKRLREIGLGEIEQAVELIARTLTQNALVTDEGRAVAERVLIGQTDGRLDNFHYFSNRV